MHSLTELEDEAFKQVSDDVNKVIPWYITFDTLYKEGSVTVSENGYYSMRDLLRKHYEESDHKYKEYIDPISYEVANTMPIGVNGDIHAVESAYLRVLEDD